MDPASPDPERIGTGVRVLESKGVLVFPTSGLYGIGADAFSVEAVRRVYAIKNRPMDQPLLVLLPTIRDLVGLVHSVPDYAESIFSLWPGGITLIFNVAEGVPLETTGGTGKIGVRLPAHPVAKKLVETFGGPITGTSANLSGCPAASDVRSLASKIQKQADLILDAGPLAGGVGSTILDVTCWPVKVIREGRVSCEAIQNILKKG